MSKPLWCRLFGHHFGNDHVCTRCGKARSEVARALKVFGGPEALHEFVDAYVRQKNRSLYDTTYLYVAEGRPGDRDLFAINAASKQDADEEMASRHPATIVVEYIGELNHIVRTEELEHLKDVLGCDEAEYASEGAEMVTDDH